MPMSSSQLGRPGGPCQTEATAGRQPASAATEGRVDTASAINRPAVASGASRVHAQAACCCPINASRPCGVANPSVTRAAA
jgi:hypothetical protein